MALGMKLTREHSLLQTAPDYRQLKDGCGHRWKGTEKQEQNAPPQCQMNDPEVSKAEPGLPALEVTFSQVLAPWCRWLRRACSASGASANASRADSASDQNGAHSKA